MQEVQRGTRRFHQALEDEHERLEDELSGLEWSLRAGDGATARIQLAIFDMELQRYVRGEELLFPVLEMLSPTQVTSTTKMRREHGSLRRLIAAVWEALDGDDEPRSLAAVGALRSVFVLHVAKEEWLIYPLLARAVSLTAEEALLRYLH